MFRAPKFALLAVAGLALPFGSLQAEDWPGFRNAGRTGASSETGLQQTWEGQQPRLLWSTEGIGGGFASVSIVGNRIFTTGNFADGQGAVCVAADSGRELWKTTITDVVPKHSYEGSRSTPTVDGDRLYLVTSDGQLACLQTADGKIVWKREFKKEFGGQMMSGWGYSEPPLVDGDRLICTPGGKNAMLVALDKLTGEEIWRCAVPEFNRGRGAGYASVVISNGGGVKQYIQVIGQGVIGVRADDGQFLWGYGRVANGTANIPTPLVDGDYVFASTGYGTGAALLKLEATAEGVEAEEIYFKEGKELQNHHGGMVLHNGYVYLGHQHNNGFPMCVEMKTGEVAWGGNVRGPGSGSAAVIYADGNLIFRYQNGLLAMIEATPREYKLKGTWMPEYTKTPSWAHPAIADGKLYLREQDRLMCYDLRK